MIMLMTVPISAKIGCPNYFPLSTPTEKQRKLLERHGDMVLLDGTYRTTKYALALFLMVVRTNVSYIPFVQFICVNETAEAISEALDKIKVWNPRYFMLDYPEQELQALQKCFQQQGNIFAVSL